MERGCVRMGRTYRYDRAWGKPNKKTKKKKDQQGVKRKQSTHTHQRTKEELDEEYDDPFERFYSKRK